jgi:hypothetical protein
MLLCLPHLAAAHSGHHHSERSPNPQISVILNGGFNTATLDPELYYLPGFQMGEEAALMGRGFAINEAEIDFQAAINKYLYGYLSVALEQDGTETEIELEEAYLLTTLKPIDLQIKAGRFFSGIGYLNHHHSHQWDFVDQSLVYRAFFANQYHDDGVQVRWIAPCPLYFEIGAEAFPGRNFPAAGPGDRLGALSLFSHLRDQSSEYQSWQLGLSYLYAKPQNREAILPGEDDLDSDEDDENTFLFSGRSNTVGLDLVWKLALDGNFDDRVLIVQSEIYKRAEKGTVFQDDDNSSLNSHQWGMYLQTVYQFIPQWRIGWRYDWLKARNNGFNLAVLDDTLLLPDSHNPHQNTMMVDYSPTESSRFRMQYNRDYSVAKLNQIFMLQFIVEFGSHAEHLY